MENRDDVRSSRSTLVAPSSEEAAQVIRVKGRELYLWIFLRELDEDPPVRVH
jgi:hypothetical protein